LEGEACFEVSKDSDRPFVVHTAYTSVQVLGTLFNVSSYEKDENTVVTLVNGKVRVSADSVLKVLQPNEQLVLNHETNDMEVKKVVADNYVAWTRGLFRFEGIPLRLLMMKLARWYDITYEFKDEGLEKISFTGGVWKYDDIHLILEMIEEIARVELKMIDNKVIIDKKRR
jgi:ferric-dicitrate binding protein FerR (iron transport regulator)